MFKRFMPALTCLTLLGAGCAQQKAPAEQVDKEVLAADSRHMAQLYSQWEQAVSAQSKDSNKPRGSREMPLDLSDEAQFRFVKNRLQAAGSTPENSPQLFRRLDKLHKDKKAGVPGAQTRKDMVTSTTAGTDPRENPWCGHLLPLSDVDSTDASVAKFQTSGLVTCFNGSDYGYVDVTAFATDAAHQRFRVLGTQSYEEYAGKVLETPTLDLGVKVSPDELLFVDSVSMAFNEATGESHVSYTVTESSLASLGAQPTPVPTNTLNFEHPREPVGKHQTDNPIRTCLERGSVTGYLDCDYASGSKDPNTGDFLPFVKPYTGIGAVDSEATRVPSGVWVSKRGDYWAPASGTYDTSHLYLAMRGKHRLTLETWCRVDSQDSDVALILLETGGKCAGGSASGSVVAHSALPYKPYARDYYDNTVVVFPFDGLVDFGRDCMGFLQNTRLLVRSTVKSTCMVLGATNTWGTTQRINTRTQNVQTIDWRNACLAKGTQVVKADGQAVAVEQVKVGDKLLANGNGLALTVTTVSRGGESKPVVKLRDEKGAEVMVTGTHPMVTARRGVVQAGELAVGDVLLTRTGATKLVGVERVPYNDEVFNFALGTPEELAKAPAEARTLYANGFLVGDSQTQATLEKQKLRDSREVLTKLNGAWHEDFRRHQARQKSAQR
ncbi:Hint domain-containing protein [Archangium sp.]|uniref:Hint domain-containing protein n=1 Tax=Archangium sp. TaxID=1872627 RepID=UPI002ED95C45